MIYIVIVAVIGVIIFTLTQRRRGKGQEVEKDALTLAWEKKDYDAYLALIDEKIAKNSNRKEKHILATLKLPVYILEKDWEKMDALKRNVKMTELPKKIRVTFLCQYIIGLCLSDRPAAALKWMEREAPLLTEAEANGTYALYIDSVRGLEAFYRGDYTKSRALFSELKAKNVPGDLYAPLFESYLAKIDEAETKQTKEMEE